MNHEKSQALRLIQSKLQNIATSMTDYSCTSCATEVESLIGRIQGVCSEIDGMVASEEAVLDEMFAEFLRDKNADDCSSLPNGILQIVADDIRGALGGCFVSAQQTTHHDGERTYVISAQPDGKFTPSDLIVLFKSRGYKPTFKKAVEYSQCIWSYYDVSWNGLKFEFHSTVAFLEAPDIERFDEPACDEHLLSTD